MSKVFSISFSIRTVVLGPWASLNTGPCHHYNSSEVKAALINSRFIRAMLTIEISFGHSASHSFSLVQLPNPSLSMVRNMFKARLAACRIAQRRILEYADQKGVDMVVGGLRRILAVTAEAAVCA